VACSTQQATLAVALGELSCLMKRLYCLREPGEEMELSAEIEVAVDRDVRAARSFRHIDPGLNLVVAIPVPQTASGGADDDVNAGALLLHSELLGQRQGLCTLILLGGRSETIRGLRGDGRDERFRMIDIHATALAGLAVITAIVIAFIVELANGHDGNPYAWLGAIAGLTYLAAIVVFRIRG
jgi:hypothetical protein